jgi:hypothetical protein
VLEEVARQQFASLAQVGPVEHGLGAGGDRGALEQGSVQMGVPAQDLGQQGSLAAADVDDAANVCAPTGAARRPGRAARD